MSKHSIAPVSAPGSTTPPFGRVEAAAQRIAAASQPAPAPVDLTDAQVEGLISSLTHSEHVPAHLERRARPRPNPKNLWALAEDIDAALALPAGDLLAHAMLTLAANSIRNFADALSEATR